MAYTLALAHSYGRLISELKQQIEKVRGWVGEVVMWARERLGESMVVFSEGLIALEECGKERGGRDRRNSTVGRVNLACGC